MMKRGQIYFDRYRDAQGRDRRIPFLIVSEDDYNARSQFVTGVRLSRYDSSPCPQHVFIPRSAFAETDYLGDCYALVETINSIRQTNLEGPIGVLASNYYTKAVEDAIKIHVGIEMTKPYVPMERPIAMPSAKPSAQAPWYSAAGSQQTRVTQAAEE